MTISLLLWQIFYPATMKLPHFSQNNRNSLHLTCQVQPDVNWSSINHLFWNLPLDHPVKPRRWSQSEEVCKHIQHAACSTTYKLFFFILNPLAAWPSSWLTEKLNISQSYVTTGCLLIKLWGLVSLIIALKTDKAMPVAFWRCWGYYNSLRKLSWTFFLCFTGHGF